MENYFYLDIIWLIKRSTKKYTRFLLDLKIEFSKVTVFKVSIIKNCISDTGSKQLEIIKMNSINSSVKNIKQEYIYQKLSTTLHWKLQNIDKVN